jgi:hypothetical protein
MKSFRKEERWESIFLFSSEGFLMASFGSSSDYDEDHLLELTFSLKDFLELLNDDLGNKEIAVQRIYKKKFIFRYFNAWGEQVVLAAVVSGRKGYRRALGKLIKLIRSLS